MDQKFTRSQNFLVVYPFKKQSLAPDRWQRMKMTRVLFTVLLGSNLLSWASSDFHFSFCLSVSDLVAALGNSLKLIESGRCFFCNVSLRTAKMLLKGNIKKWESAWERVILCFCAHGSLTLYKVLPTCAITKARQRRASGRCEIQIARDHWKVGSFDLQIVTAFIIIVTELLFFFFCIEEVFFLFFFLYIFIS